MEILPKTNQIFYVLFDDENNMLHSVNESHIFTTPFITKAMNFESKQKAENFIVSSKIEFKVVRVSPKYNLV